MKLSRRYMPHTVTVEPYVGSSSTGPLYGAPFSLPCLAQGGHRLVRAPDGAEVVSSLTLYAEHGKAAEVPARSRVTRNGSTTVVIASTDHDDGDMGAPQHAEVVCE